MVSQRWTEFQNGYNRRAEGDRNHSPRSFTLTEGRASWVWGSTERVERRTRRNRTNSQYWTLELNQNPNKRKQRELKPKRAYKVTDCLPNISYKWKEAIPQTFMCWPTFLGLVTKHRNLSQSCPALILEIYGFLWDTHPFWIYLVWLEILFTLTPLILVFSSKFSRVTGVTRQGWISRTRISCCGLSRPWVCEATLVSCCCPSACCQLPGSNLRGSWKNQKQHPASSQQLESDTYAAGRPDWAQLASLKKSNTKWHIAKQRTLWNTVNLNVAALNPIQMFI